MPDLILASPALRSRLTVAEFCGAWQAEEKSLIWDAEIYASSVSYLLKLLRGLPDNLNRVALFGHNPEFTELVNYLNTVFIENIPTCGVVLLSLQADSWAALEKNSCKIQFFIYPKLFEEDGSVKSDKRTYIYLPKNLKKS